MLNACFNFSNAVNKSASLILALILLSFSPALAQDAVQTSGTAAGTESLREYQVHEVQKPSTGSQYKIGDRISLFIDLKENSIETGEALVLQLPDVKKKIEDLGWYLDPNTQFLGGTFRFIASPIQTGSLTLPALLILKSDQTKIGITSTITFQVIGPESTQNTQAELLEPEGIRLPTKYWFVLSIISVAIILMIIFAYRKLKMNKAKEKPKMIPQVEAEPDHIIALKKIELLFNHYPYQIENLKPISFGISETLKEFFTKRFHVDALESTTNEMIELLKNESLSKENLFEIKTYFDDLDLIKFTDQQNYQDFDLQKYQDLKIRAQFIIQKWALKIVSEDKP